MKAKEIVDVICRLAPPDAGVPNDGQSGWKFGDPEQEVTAMGFCWSPTLKVLQQAAEWGIQMIVTHEPLIFPMVRTPWYENAPTEEKGVNRRRLKWLEDHRMCVYGAHSNWDVKPEIGIADALGATLSFGDPVYSGFICRVYESPPIRLEDLVRKVKRVLEVDKLRVIGDLNREVTKIGTQIGGLGQTFCAAEEPWKHGAEVVIFGEMLDYTIRYAVELGLAVIEAGHIATENPGIRNFVIALREACPELDVHFLDSGQPWQCV